MSAKSRKDLEETINALRHIINHWRKLAGEVERGERPSDQLVAMVLVGADSLDHSFGPAAESPAGVDEALRLLLSHIEGRPGDE